MAKNFITNTTSLKTTHADVRKLDAKKINLKGKNILDHIKDNVPIIKHANDTRETITENDLWGLHIETTADGTIVVYDDWVTNPNASNDSAWNTLITIVEDNKAYIGDTGEQAYSLDIGDTFFANIQTERMQDGYYMFRNCTALTSFYSDLPSLTNGDNMFRNCTALTSFYSDLPSLTNGDNMFYSCTNLRSFYSDLPSLTNGVSMFYKCSKLTSFSSDLSSLTNGKWMFLGCTNLTSFSSDLPNLTNGNAMFDNCTALTSFSSDLSSLTNGGVMFGDCTALTSFSSNLPNLTNGNGMFGDCTALTSFYSDLPNLTNGGVMFFKCTNLRSFYSDLSSLTNGSNMFCKCSQLTTFKIYDLSSLTNGNEMFTYCTNLTSFSSDLSSLTNGSNMFNSCKLDAESVMYITDTIKDITAEKQLYIDGTIPYVTLSYGTYSAPKGFMSDGKYVYTYNSHKPLTETISASNVGKLTLGINVTNNSSTIQQQLEDFAKEALFDSWAELKQAFVDKGWTVTFLYGGTTTNITLSEDEQFRGVPVYARLIEVSEEDKDKAEYCTEDGTKFYNIDWGHDVTDYDYYQHFGSLLEACGHFGVIPVKYLEEK